MRLVAVIPALALIGAGAAAGRAVAEDAPAKLTFSGHFTLNAAASEDFRTKMQQARGSGGSGSGGGEGHGGGQGGGGGHWGGGGGGMGGGGGHWGGGGGGGHRSAGGGEAGSQGGAPGGGQGDTGHETMRAVFEAPEEMTITDTDSEVVILEKDGRVRTLHPTGKSEKNDTTGDEVKVRRDAGRLVVETKTSRGTKITETYTRDPEHRQVDVQLVLEPSSRPSVSIRRVYDEATTES